MGRQSVRVEQETSRKDLPDVGVLEIPDQVKSRVEHLLERGGEIKLLVGKKHDKGKDNGSGLAEELDRIATELLEIQFQYGLEGLRSGRFVFVSRMQDGRETFDKKLLCEELLARFGGVCKRGVDVLEIINQCFEAATKTGDPFPVRELEILD